MHVISHLGERVSPHSLYHPHIRMMREEARNHLLRLAWDPLGLKERHIRQVQARLPKEIGRKIAQDLQKAQDRMLVERERLRAVLQQDAAARVLKAQMEVLAREQSKQDEILGQMLRELAADGAQVIAEKFRDDQPVVRWLAAQLTQRKRLPLERELIELLADKTPQVREAARQALVRLSRGNDFGPALDASAAQAQRAASAWRHWLALQQRTPTHVDSLPSERLGSESSR